MEAACLQSINLSIMCVVCW